MRNKCPIFSSQLSSSSSRKDHTHQHNTETGATDTRDWSRVLLEFQRQTQQKKSEEIRRNSNKVMTGWQMNREKNKCKKIKAAFGRGEKKKR